MGTTAAGNATIFDKILRREIPAEIVYEDERVLAFRDTNPQAPVHVLVIPKTKAVRLAGLGEWPAAAVGELFQAVARVATELSLDAHGYRIVCNSGRDGGQSVDYLHVHILGGRPMTWPPG